MRKLLDRGAHVACALPGWLYVAVFFVSLIVWLASGA